MYLQRFVTTWQSKDTGGKKKKRKKKGKGKKTRKGS